MIVEIKGINFDNKGAELMLHAILQELRPRIPGALFAMAPHPKHAPYHSRAEHGLYQKVWLHRLGIQWGYLAWLLPRILRQTYGLVIDREVDVVLDASGFAYSDQWGPRLTHRMRTSIQQWKRRGTKVIFLPQAFGPFHSRRIKNDFSIIARLVDLIYARDDISFGYVSELSPDKSRIRQAPDFTACVKGVVPKYINTFSGDFCIIPNVRMQDMVTTNNRSLYVPLLVKIIEYLREQGCNPFILVHGGDKDKEIGNIVISRLKYPIPIIQESNVLHVKGIISKCRGVVGSRFHGLVSAINQEIPAAGIGWSHKYEMLFNEVGFKDGVIPLDIDSDRLRHVLHALISPSESLKNLLHNAANDKTKKLDKMWNEVASCILSQGCRLIG